MIIFKCGYPVVGYLKGSENFSGELKGYELFQENFKGG